MEHTLGQAAKATGKSKSTILRALKAGRLSGAKQDDGSWRIDAAELHRVFPVPVSEPDGVTRHAPPKDTGMDGDVQRALGRLEGESDALKAQIAALQEALDLERARVARYEARLLGPPRRWSWPFRWPWSRAGSRQD